MYHYYVYSWQDWVNAQVYNLDTNGDEPVRLVPASIGLDENHS